MPRWIDQQQEKHLRQKEAQAALKAAHARTLEHHKARRADEADIDARSKAAEAARVPVARGRGIRPGERRLPDLSDEELRQALGSAHPTLPRHLIYPHLLILRERGYTRSIYGDLGAGEFGVAGYRGDVITEVGERWLNQT